MLLVSVKFIFSPKVRGGYLAPFTFPLGSFGSGSPIRELRGALLMGGGYLVISTDMESGTSYFCETKKGLKNTILALTNCKGQNDIFEAILWVPQRVMLHILAQRGQKSKIKCK